MVFYPVSAALLACTLAAYGQTDPAAKSTQAAYQSFFSRLNLIESALKTPGSPITPRVGETLGVSESEVRDMIALAGECMAKQAATFQSLRALTLEARLQSLANGKVDAETSEQLRLLERARESIVPEAVVRLRNLLGEQHFQTVDRFVRLQESSGFPNLTDSPRAVPAAKK